MTNCPLVNPFDSLYTSFYINYNHGGNSWEHLPVVRQSQFLLRPRPR